jgi:glycosyltransferase involved in cell wall biosynthesis
MPDQSCFQFQPSDLDKARKPGLSGFMRIRNGEDWLALSIESHLPYFDEIVAVYNDCSDRTPQILEDLATRFPDKIKVVHYEPVVHPSNSDLHIRTPASSVHSIVNYYNFSLAQTTRTIATKLDDDHLAIPAQWQAMRDFLAGKQFRLGNEMPCFSGINLVHTDGGLKIHATVPLAGQGDHWFFEVAPGRYFVKDRRYEHFNRKGLKLSYMGFAYWHLKFLKKDHGFGNYKLETNPNSRFHKQKARFEAGREGISLQELARRCQIEAQSPSLTTRIARLLSSKARLKYERAATFPLDRLQKDFVEAARILLRSE